MTTLTQPFTTDRVQLISRITAGLVALLALLAFVLSYSSLQHLAQQHGVGAWLSYAWPGLLDFAMIVFSLAILRANLRQERAVYPWALTIAFATLATIANILDVATLGIPPVVIGAGVKALAPVSLVLSFELLMGMIRAEVRRAAVVQSLADLRRQAGALAGELEQARADAAAELDKIAGQIDARRGQLERLKADIAGANSRKRAASTEEMNAARQAKIEERRQQAARLLADGLAKTEIADALGVSAKTIRRDLAAVGANGNGHHPAGEGNGQ